MAEFDSLWGHQTYYLLQILKWDRYFISCFLNSPKVSFYFIFPFLLLDIDIFQNFYVAFPPSLHLFSRYPSFRSWNVILSVKYGGKLKCPWWSIALLGFHSCQWQKLTNSDIGVPESISLLWFVLSGVFKVWVPHPTSVQMQFHSRKQLQKSARKIPKNSATVHLRMKRSCVYVCVFTYVIDKFWWKTEEKGDRLILGRSG